MNKEELLNEFKKFKKMGLHIDMTRGKPSSEQLDLSMPVLDVLSSKSKFISEEGFDCRNYGCLTGLKECKDLFASILEVSSENIIVYGNSSLNIMYECLSDAFLYGVCGSTPWSKLKKVKWLCPVPGYDRHFAMCEHLGIEMINVPMNKDGPNMGVIEELVKDPLVKGIWCVPKYSNPTGITYSNEVVKRFAKLKPAANDFRVYWDNAYALHDFYEDGDELLEIFSMAKKYNNEDLFFEFTSTSKISFPGAGVAVIAVSHNNFKDIQNHLTYKTIGYDKINQLRHVKYLKNLSHFKRMVQLQASILKPKFELIDKILKEKVGGIATWTKPNGGYFISLHVPGKAKEVIEKCKECGVILTDSGCAFPYHFDKDNSHIRIAPSPLSFYDLTIAMNVLCTVIKLV